MGTTERNSLSGKFRPARMEQRSGHCLGRGPGEIEVPVKMRATRNRTKRPRELYYILGLILGRICVG